MEIFAKKKLSLNKETLKLLSPADTNVVAGASSEQWTYFSCYSDCTSCESDSSYCLCTGWNCGA